jgi:flagellar biosynthetic protein FliR
MENVMQELMIKFEIFLMLLARCSAIFLITPIFGRRNLPAVFKIGLAFIISIILVNVVEAPQTMYGSFIEIAGFIIKEVIIGLIIGFVTYVIFASIYFAGQIIDMKTGFGIVNVLDPQTNTQVPIIGNFLYIFTLVAFITIDGHHMMLSALVRSFQIVPVGKLQITVEAVNVFAEIMMDTFIIGFKISAPVIAAILLTDVALGILAKTMPQMNVFMVGMPLKILVGIFTLMIMIPVFSTVIEALLRNMADSIYKILLHLG